MSSARRPAGTPQRSWRESQTPTLAPEVAQRIRRAVWSLLAAGLLASFVWLVVWFFGPRPLTHVFALAVTEYDVVDAPALAFAQQSLESWQEVNSLNVHLDASVTSAGRISEWLAGLRGDGGPGSVRLRKHDALIVYLAAHGVSWGSGESATAGLLGSEFHPPAEANGKVDLVSIDEILSAVESASAGRKLLVLDAGCLDRDPALGMLVNEFPSLLKEKIGNYNDVWVLVSHDLFEKSHGAYRDRQNVFAHFVTRGLAGEADDAQRPDGVDLSELYQFVRQGVASYVYQASGGRETQTPQLLGPAASQEELIRKGHAIMLTSRSRPIQNATSAEKEKGPEQGAGDPAAAKSAMRLPSLTAGPLALVSAPQETPPASATPAAVSTDNRQPTTDLQETPPAPDGEKKSPAPADKNKQASSDQPSPDQPPSDQPASDPRPDAAPQQPDQDKPADDPFLQELRKQWQTCHELSDRLKHPLTPVDYAPHRWLRWLEKLKGYEMRWLRGGTTDPRQMITDAGQELSLLRKAAQYQSQLSPALAAAQRNGRLAAVIHLRDDLLLRARYYIDSPLAFGKTDVESLIDGLGELLPLLRNPDDSDEPSPVAGAWIEHVEETCALLRATASNLDRQLDTFLRGDDWTTLEALLEFPWIPVARRMELLAKLEKLLPFAETLPESELPARSSGWKRTQQYAQLQARWLRLVDRSPESEQALEKAQGLTADATDLPEVRETGALFARARGKLIAQVRGRDAADGAAANQLRVLDARVEVSDERRIMETDRVPDVKLPAQIRLVSTAGGNPLPVDAGAKFELRWQIETPGNQRPLDLVWELVNDHPQSVRVEPVRGTVAFKNGSPLPIVVQVSTVERTSGEARLTLRVSAGDAVREDAIELSVRPQELVDLRVAVAGPRLAGMYEAAAQDPARRVLARTLRPLASGQTTFRLALHNPSKQKRTVEYRVLAITEAGLAADGYDDSLAQMLDKGGSLPRGIKLLRDKTAIELEANDEKPLALAGPVKPAAPPTPPTAPPATQSKTPEGQPIKAIVCEMVDPAFGPDARYFWLRMEPLHPSRYLLPEVNLGEDGRLVIQLQPFDRDRLPKDGSMVSWRWRQESGWTAAEATLTLERPLRVTIVPTKDVRRAPLELLIDGDAYPRAFRYLITQAGKQLPKLKDQREMQLTEPAGGERRWLRRGTPAQVKLVADFPQQGGASIVRLELRDETGETQEVKEYRSDRLIDFKLLPGEEAGAYTIATSVRDIADEFPTSRYQDQELRLVATLGNLIESCFFRLDSQPPTIRLDGRQSVIEGGKLRVRLRAFDQAGEVQKVEVALDPQAKGKWEGLEPKSATFDTKSGLWLADLPTNNKELYRATESFRFLAKAGDKAENMGEPQSFLFDVLRPPPKPTGPSAAAKKGTLRVRVTYAGAAASLLNVTVTGPKNWQGRTDQDGHFTLKDFPGGAYKFHFQGFGRANTPVESDHEFNFEPAPKGLTDETFETRKLVPKPR